MGMSETVAIAEQHTGPPGWMERIGFGDERTTDGEWPVRRDDLDRLIRFEAERRGMRVLSVHEPPRRRGPLPVYDVDDDGRMTDVVIAERA